ncbi:protein PSY3 [Rosa chinensis]|uniref:protein PSY3 n=1 Tax=Rosa chinensis TaxID=74649 RepID=UPI001AD8EFB2|nr:protein PSY3 [Rosa chinensis]
MGFGGSRVCMFLLLVYALSSSARNLILFPDREMVVIIESTEGISMGLDDYPDPGPNPRHDPPPSHPPPPNGKSGKVDGDKDDGA